MSRRLLSTVRFQVNINLKQIIRTEPINNIIEFSIWFIHFYSYYYRVGMNYRYTYELINKQTVFARSD